MKTTLYSILAAAACGMSFGQTAYTNPVGYTTETIKAGVFNLFGLTLQTPNLLVSSLTSVSATSVGDTTQNFTTLLTAGSTYLLFIKSGTGAGTVQEVTSWTTTTLTTPDMTAVVPVGSLYELRKAPTISDIFGATNQAGLLAGSATTADNIWIPTGGGAFAKYYYSPAVTFPVPAPAGWKSTAGVASGNVPIVCLDSIYIQRRGLTDISLVISGEVQTKPLYLTVEGAKYNYIGGVYPVGSTLGNSGLQSSLLSTSSSATADLVWIPDGLGGYSKHFYSPAVTFPVPATAGWKSTGGASSTNVPLKSGMIIQRRGLTTIPALISPPSAYSNL